MLSHRRLAHRRLCRLLCVYAFGQEHVAKAKAAARRVSRRLTAKPRVDDAVREANVEVKMTSSASSSI